MSRRSTATGLIPVCATTPLDLVVPLADRDVVSRSTGSAKTLAPVPIAETAAAEARILPKLRLEIGISCARFQCGHSGHAEAQISLPTVASERRGEERRGSADPAALPLLKGWTTLEAGLIKSKTSTQAEAPVRYCAFQ